MPSFLTGDIVQARIWCVDAEQASVNTMHYEIVTAGGTPTTDQAFCDGLAAVIDPLMPLIINNNANYRGIQCQLKTPLPQIYAPVSNTGGSSVGSGGATALPRQTCGLGSVSCALAGRRFRGRMYFPFPATADDTGNGTPTGAAVLRYSDVLVGMLTYTGPIAAGGSVWTPVIVHSTGKSPTPPPTQITNASVANAWATQRRRGSYGRANTSPI